MMAHMDEMMGSGSMTADDHSESMNTEMEHENDDTQNGESSHQEWAAVRVYLWRQSTPPLAG